MENKIFVVTANKGLLYYCHNYKFLNYNKIVCCDTQYISNSDNEINIS